MQSKRNLPLALLLLAVLLVYANSFGNAFHFDDFHTVTDNAAVRSLGNLPRIFRDTTAFSVLPANQTYRPVVTASLALDYALGHGYQPFWFHLSTTFWFLVLIALLYVWALQIFSRTLPDSTHLWPALGVAAWFGLHPAMAETVNYVIQRGDLYCTLGCVAALTAYAAYPGQRRRGLYLLPFVLGMLSKPPALVFPLLLLLWVLFFETPPDGSAGRRWRQAALAAMPALVTTGLLLWQQAAMTPKSYAPSILSPGAYRLTQPYVWLRYAGALFLPLHLNVDTDLQAFQKVNAQAVAGVLFTVGLVLCAVLAGRRRRWYPVAYGLWWFLLTQIPTSVYTLSEVENDHRMFFSFPGLMLAVVWTLFRVWARVSARWKSAPLVRQRWARVAYALCGFALCGYAYGAHRRNLVWHDEASLWADDIQKSPHNGRGLMIYGLTRMNRGDYANALASFERALVYTPNYPTLEINLGVVNGLLADRGEPARAGTAEEHFRRALLLAPADDLPHAYYGRWLLQHGRLQEATAELEKAVGLNLQRPMGRDLLLQAYESAGNAAAARTLAEDTLAWIPDDTVALAAVHRRGHGAGGQDGPAAAMINASLASYQAGRYEQSIAQAQQALALDPRAAEAWNNVGAGYGALHQWGPAIEAERKALALNPGLAIAANNLRWFLAQEAGKSEPAGARDEVKTAADWVNESLRLNQAGQYRESTEAARKALALDPHSAEAWNNIAANAEAVHRWEDAIDAAQHALAIRPDFTLARNNLAWSLQQRASSAHP